RCFRVTGVQTCALPMCASTPDRKNSGSAHSDPEFRPPNSRECLGFAACPDGEVVDALHLGVVHYGAITQEGVQKAERVGAPEDRSEERRVGKGGEARCW